MQSCPALVVDHIGSFYVPLCARVFRFMSVHSPIPRAPNCSCPLVLCTTLLDTTFLWHKDEDGGCYHTQTPPASLTTSWSRMRCLAMKQQEKSTIDLQDQPQLQPLYHSIEDISRSNSIFPSWRPRQGVHEDLSSTVILNSLNSMNQPRYQRSKSLCI